MGIMDFLTQGGGNQDPGASQYSDVPMGYRLGLLGNILASAAQGQAPNPAGFAMMAKMKDDAKEQRKAAKQMELATKYLDKRPDLKPLVESGAISLADIIKMDREDSTKAADRKYSEEWWIKQKQYEAENNPDRIWLEQFAGGNPPPPAGVESVTPGATPAPVPTSGVPTPPTSATPDMPPVPGDTANGQVSPITAKLRQRLNDPLINDNEAAIIMQTVRNPDDLRSAYDTILKNRTEMKKVQLEEQKAADAKAEAAKKEIASENVSKANLMKTVSAVDKMMIIMDEDGIPATGWGSLAKLFPESNAGKFAANLDQVRSSISFEKLQQMRENSQNGASGLGQVSNYEQRMLGSSEGALEQSVDEETMRTTLTEIKARMIAFNTPSPEDPSKSILTVDSEKLAANPSPEAVQAFEKKYGVGSSSVITGETTPVTDRPVEQEADIPPAPEGVDAEAWKFMTPEDRALWQN